MIPAVKWFRLISARLFMRAPLRTPILILFTLVVLSALDAPPRIAAYTSPENRLNPAPPAHTVASLLVQARQLIQHNKLAEASQVLSEGLRQYPHEATLLNFLGVVDAKEDKTRAAEENFQKAIVESPGYEGAYMNLAHLYQAEIGRRPGAISAAVRTFQRLISIDPGNVQAISELAVLDEQGGELNQAQSLLLRASSLEPGSVSPLLELTQVANRQRDYRGALGYLAHARALEPKNARIHFLFGMVCVEMELHQEAYASLKKAVALDPDNPYYNYALGAVTAQREDAREAIPFFQKYCALRPRDPRGKLAVAEAFYFSHALNEARTKLLEVVNEKPTAAGANYYLGRIANDETEWREAAQYFQDAIRQNPRYADAYAMLGHVYLEEKMYSESATALDRALKLDPNNYQGNLWLTALYERTKDPRAKAQAQHFTTVQKAREERAKLFLRTIRIVP